MKLLVQTSQICFILLISCLFITYSCKKDENGDNGGTEEKCPGSFSYQGQTYHGVMIGEQCWMKENLNYETGNSKCYGDNPANCDTYGRMYDWETIMNGALGTAAMPSGVRGICPEGWHVPSDMEWQVLEGTVDSESEPFAGIWNALAYRGYDVGLNLKSQTGWDEANGASGGGTDAYGFKALPGGFWNTNNYDFRGIGKEACFWTCTENTEETAMMRQLSYANDNSAREYSLKNAFFNLRCVKDRPKHVRIFAYHHGRMGHL